LKGCLRVDLQPSDVKDAGRARTGRRLDRWTAGPPAKERRDCKNADCASQAAAPKAAYSSVFAAPFAFDGSLSPSPPPPGPCAARPRAGLLLRAPAPGTAGVGGTHTHNPPS
jgi:hypothetical protein